MVNSVQAAKSRTQFIVNLWFELKCEFETLYETIVINVTLCTASVTHSVLTLTFVYRIPYHRCMFHVIYKS